jgi:hypothetical protein
MRLDIDRVIQTGVGVSLSCLSVSGIMCINRGSCPTARPEACPKSESGSCPTARPEACPKSESGSCPKSESGSCPALNCSRINLNFGLGAMGLTGLLLVYKSVRM